MIYSRAESVNKKLSLKLLQKYMMKFCNKYFISYTYAFTVNLFTPHSMDLVWKIYYKYL